MCFLVPELECDEGKSAKKGSLKEQREEEIPIGPELHTMIKEVKRKPKPKSLITDAAIKKRLAITRRLALVGPFTSDTLFGTELILKRMLRDAIEVYLRMKVPVVQKEHIEEVIHATEEWIHRRVPLERIGATPDTKFSFSAICFYLDLDEEVLQESILEKEEDKT